MHFTTSLLYVHRAETLINCYHYHFKGLVAAPEVIPNLNTLSYGGLLAFKTIFLLLSSFNWSGFRCHLLWDCLLFPQKEPRCFY